MWAQYRKTMIPIQLIILVVCGVLWFAAKMPPIGVLLFLFTMEVGAIAGAWWAARMHRRVNKYRADLPLRPR